MVSIFCLVHVAVGCPDIYFLSLDFQTGFMQLHHPETNCLMLTLICMIFLQKQDTFLILNILPFCQLNEII